jgi:hypothetical protein
MLARSAQALVKSKHPLAAYATPEPCKRTSVTRRLPPANARLSYFFFPPSSAMYIISCLKINRLGASSRVSRTMCLS